MPTEKFTNNGQTTLNGAINNSVTSVVVTSAATLPTAGNFRIRVDDEIMFVSAVSGSTLTVTRGAEGSTAVSHTDLTTVRHVLTAAAVSQVAADAAGGVAWTLVTKAADEDVSSSTTLQDDDALLTPSLTSTKIYEFELVLLFKNPVSTGGNLKIAVGEDSTSRGTYLGIGSNTSGNPTQTVTACNLASTQSYITVSTAFQIAKMTGLFISNGGAFKLQWAQNTSSANVVRVYAGSFLRYRQVI